MIAVTVTLDVFDGANPDPLNVTPIADLGLNNVKTHILEERHLKARERQAGKTTQHPWHPSLPSPAILLLLLSLTQVTAMLLQAPIT